jgi:hypothetical protein
MAQGCGHRRQPRDDTDLQAKLFEIQLAERGGINGQGTKFEPPFELEEL